MTQEPQVVTAGRRIAAEALGTFFLLVGIVGSGVMAADLSDGNTAVALLANAVATGAILFVLITVLGPISGAHFNPAVTLAFWLRGEIAGGLGVAYVLAQICFGILGVWAAHFMYGLPIFQLSTTARSGAGQWGAEALATFGLVFVIQAALKARAEAVPMVVALYITGAYWFTSSTSFANPAVTIARALSDTFAGILPAHMPGFIAMQLLGAVVAVGVARWLFAGR